MVYFAGPRQRRHRANGTYMYQEAIEDIHAGLRNWQVWSLMGWHDIRNRYRRSYVGPLWTTFSIAFFVVALGTLYASLFGRPIEIYIPHLTLGIVGWSYLSGVVVGSCNAFTEAENFIKGINQPLTTYVFRVIWRYVVTFAYHLVVFLLVLLYFRIPLGPMTLLAVIGVGLIFLNSIWVGMVMAIAAARYRDLFEIVSNLMRIAFFLTPVIWMPDMLGGRSVYLDFNPFYHFLELFRAPLLGQPPELLNWTVAVGVAVIGWPTAILMLARTRDRVPYWV